MTCEIYYFSGNGHSLLAARDMAEKLDAECIPMLSRIQEEEIHIEADVIGLAFPIYHATFGESGLPNMVAAFVDKLRDLRGKYIFAIGTHSGFPGFTMEKLNHRLMGLGGELAAGLPVLLNVSPYKPLQKIRHELFNQPLVYDKLADERMRHQRLEDWHANLPAYVQVIENRQTGVIESPGPIKRWWWNGYLALQKKMALGHYQALTKSDSEDFMALTYTADSTFSVTDACKGCGTCVKVCPAQNIDLVDGKPVWLHHCENCAACYHWCPSRAIVGDMVSYEVPVEATGIRLKDMLAQTAVYRE
jgi:ferredoxin/flavodoxin